MIAAAILGLFVYISSTYDGSVFDSINSLDFDSFEAGGRLVSIYDFAIGIILSVYQSIINFVITPFREFLIEISG